MVEAFVAPGVGGGLGFVVGAAAWRAAGAHRGLQLRTTVALAAALSMMLGLAFRTPLLALVGPLAGGFVAVELKRRRRRSRDRRRRAGLPIVVDAMVQQLRSGTGLRVACAAPVSVDAEVDEVLQPLVEALARQRSLRDAVDALQVEASRRDWHDAQLFGATLAALVDRGGPAVMALQRLRLTLMGVVEARSRAEAQAGQARASAALLAGAPTLFALVVALADPDVGHLYLREPLGALCVIVALLLSQAGWQWMNREVDRALSRRLARDRQEALAPTIELIAMTIGAGGTPADGVALVAERGPPVVRPGFVAVLDSRRQGRLLIDALPLLTEQLGADYHPLATALAANEHGGAPVGALLQQLADEADRARRRSGDLALAQLPVRLLIPLVCCQLPAAVVGAVVPLTIVALRHLRG